MKIKDLALRIPLAIEIVFSVAALATENYWLFLAVGAAVAYDGAAYFINNRK
ncbi:MAG TPA: hypothetical protein VMD02_02480 [Candidatus Omnitrophota bacterium]|nr:hypothetical protein [Candidatus Omnitrophota bacterium]